MANKKFKLVAEKGTTLKRLVALRDFSVVKKGEKGGLLEKETNLSHSGDAWVFGELKITCVLCSRFNFEFDWQLKLWQKLEAQFEKEVKVRSEKVKEAGK